MKKIFILLSASLVLLLAACAKEDGSSAGSTPISVDGTLAELPEGFDQWGRIVYVFDHNKCRAIYNLESGAEMPSKIDFRKGDEVVVVAFQSTENIEFTPSEKGAVRLAYKMSVVDPSRPVPQIWTGSATSADGSLSVRMQPLTASVKVGMSGLDKDLESVSLELPYVFDGLYPSGLSLEASSPDTKLRILPSDSGKTLHYLPMKDVDGGYARRLEMSFPDRTESGILTLERAIAAGDVIEADLSMTTDDLFGGGKLRFSFASEETPYSHRLSLWKHLKERNTDYVKTEFPMKSGKNMAFVFGSGGGWNEDDLYSDDFRYWADLAKIDFYKACGFDFFRIPIDEDGLWHPDGTLRPHGIKLLHEIVDECISKEMRVLLDLHWLSISNHFPNEESELHYKNCWRTLHDEFKDYPNEWVAYELINEPTCSGDYWNEFIANSIEMIRDMGETNRVVVCTVSNGADPSGAKGFTLPSGDPNLVMTIHTYYHTYFTFYRTGHGGEWGYYDGPVHYPGRFVRDDEVANLTQRQLNCCDEWFLKVSSDKGMLRSEMKQAVDVARELGVPLFCGEYGCSEFCPLSDRINWFRDKCDLFREFGMSYAQWFGFGEYNNDPMPNPDIVKAMNEVDITGKFYWGPSGVEWHD